MKKKYTVRVWYNPIVVEIEATSSIEALQKVDGMEYTPPLAYRVEVETNR